MSGVAHHLPATKEVTGACESSDDDYHDERDDEVHPWLLFFSGDLVHFVQEVGVDERPARDDGVWR